MARLVKTSLATVCQSTSALSWRGLISATNDIRHCRHETVDGVVRHAKDVEAPAVGHVDRIALAQLQHLLWCQRQHGEHAHLAADIFEARIGISEPVADP